MLPDYISKTAPNPKTARTPWYKSTAPSYAGIFLWVVFYMQLATGTLTHAGVGLCLAALAVAGLLSFGLYYYAPAMLGMKTGYPLYVVGSSTFGTTGGYLMPGLLIGVLQLGWLAVNTAVSTSFILNGLGQSPRTGTVSYTVIAVAWGYVMAYIGVKGIQYVARVSLYLNLIAFLMVLVVFLKTAGGISSYSVPGGQYAPFIAFTLILQNVIGFFATAGAAGTDFGMNNGTAKDVRWGGLIGISAAILYAGGLPLMSVAGAHGMDPTFTGTTYDSVIHVIGGFLGTAMFFLFAIASIAPACFCAFIAGNSFSTMIPSVPRMTSTMIGATVAVLLAVTGAANNLVNVFTIVGASFGPVCGAMTADYLLSGKKWAGPRQGINLAGYIAWALGFAVGILPFLPVSETLKQNAQPVVVYSYIVGFVVYFVLAKAGLQPKAVPVGGEPALSNAARAR
jgi:cytosine permease